MGSAVPDVSRAVRLGNIERPWRMRSVVHHADHGDTEVHFQAIDDGHEGEAQHCEDVAHLHETCNKEYSIILGAIH